MALLSRFFLHGDIMGSTILGYQYDVIQEDVSSNDVFPHKTHEGIKYSLFKLITTSDSSCTIGLEGQWGAGKSTVIHLLKEEFSKSSDKKTLFFTFDAWAHEGDPLRKVFLETLISNIEQDHFLSSLLKEITGLKRTVEVQTSKKTSKFADYLAIFTLLVPIGAAILSAIDYKGLYGPWSSQAVRPHLPFIFGLLLSLAPLFVILFWGLFSKKNSKGERDWSLLASNSTENYTQNITEEGEKSSVEFEKFFSRILSYVIDDKNLYDKVIIVVDNLDRVDSSHARQLWSTLQPFFIGSRQDLALSWKKKVWFIVPYDREGLSKIWDHQDPSSQQPSGEVAISFLSKSFQIVAEVPSPVLSEQKGNSLKKISYSHLNLDRWLAWEVFLQTNAYSLKIVLPNKGVITDLGNQYLPSQYQIPESNLKSLIYLNELNPDSDEWDGVLNNIIVWSGRGGNRELGNNLAYVLMLRLFANEKNKKRFNEAANMNQFWQNSLREPIDEKSYISVLAGVCFEDKLQHITYINDEMKRYWTETVNSESKKSFVFELLTETGNRRILWSMLKNEKNKLAMELIEENKDVEELFDSDEYFLSLGEYWIEHNQAELFAQKFLKNGVFEKARDHLAAQPIEYAYVLSLLQSTEESSIRNYVNQLVESLSRDTWKTAFDSDSWLLNCVIDKEVKLDHKYRVAFEEFFINLIEGKARGSDWQWKNFPDLFAKAIDKNKLLKKLIANYFDSEIDSLDDRAFNSFTEVIRGQLKNINMPKVMDRLILWIDQKKWSRIEWLADLNLVFQDVPEGLLTRLNELKNSEEPIVKNTVIKLIIALNIDLPE